ncbi:MAG: hypothetical protein ACK5P2_06570 [Pseudanabaena sp.]
MGENIRYGYILGIFEAFIFELENIEVDLITIDDVSIVKGVGCMTLTIALISF